MDERLPARPQSDLRARKAGPVSTCYMAAENVDGE